MKDTKQQAGRVVRAVGRFATAMLTFLGNFLLILLVIVGALFVGSGLFVHAPLLLFRNAVANPVEGVAILSTYAGIAFVVALVGTRSSSYTPRVPPLGKPTTPTLDEKYSQQLSELQATDPVAGMIVDTVVTFMMAHHETTSRKAFWQNFVLSLVLLCLGSFVSGVVPLLVEHFLVAGG